MPDHPYKVRLGRKPNVPDDRDWTLAKLRRKMAAARPTPPDSLLDKTLREAIDERNPFVTTWQGLLALWAWIKSILKPKPPSPPTPNTDGPLWELKILLDQGNTGTCVGNAWAEFLAAAPVEDPNIDESVARAIYYESTCIGGACDSTYQNGSTTRDGVKAVQKRGRVSAYAFAASNAEIDDWLDHDGPVVVGTDWYNGSFDIDANGFINLTGGVAGGHEYILLQDVRSAGYYLAQNSWDGWGINNTGRFKIRKADMATLQANGGDACLATELPL